MYFFFKLFTPHSFTNSITQAIDDNNYESAEDFVCEPDIIQHGSDSEPEMPEEENEPNPESCPEDDDLILGL